jgi:hypothetical protein
MNNYFTWGFLYGHPIHIRSEEYTVNDGEILFDAWRFTETGKLADDIDKFDLVCPKCGKTARDTGGDDPCIANIPGVKAACCGHGVEEAYLVLDDDTRIEGTVEVMKVVNELRKNMIEEL